MLSYAIVGVKNASKINIHFQSVMYVAAWPNYGFSGISSDIQWTADESKAGIFHGKQLTALLKVLREEYPGVEVFQD